MPIALKNSDRTDLNLRAAMTQKIILKNYIPKNNVKHLQKILAGLEGTTLAGLEGTT